MATWSKSQRVKNLWTLQPIVLPLKNIKSPVSTTSLNVPTLTLFYYHTINLRVNIPNWRVSFLGIASLDVVNQLFLALVPIVYAITLLANLMAVLSHRHLWVLVWSEQLPLLSTQRLSYSSTYQSRIWYWFILCCKIISAVFYLHPANTLPKMRNHHYHHQYHSHR